MLNMDSVTELWLSHPGHFLSLSIANEIHPDIKKTLDLSLSLPNNIPL